MNCLLLLRVFRLSVRFFFYGRYKRNKPLDSCGEKIALLDFLSHKKIVFEWRIMLHVHQNFINKKPPS
jgi:hypothetical protein